MSNNTATFQASNVTGYSRILQKLSRALAAIGAFILGPDPKTLSTDSLLDRGLAAREREEYRQRERAEESDRVAYREACERYAKGAAAELRLSRAKHQEALGGIYERAVAHAQTIGGTHHRKIVAGVIRHVTEPPALPVELSAVRSV